jgi:hypothetical protein
MSSAERPAGLLALWLIVLRPVVRLAGWVAIANLAWKAIKFIKELLGILAERKT